MSISRSCETIYIGVVAWGIDENEVTNWIGNYNCEPLQILYLLLYD